MASIPTFFLLLLMLFANDASCQRNHSNIIKLGSSLSPSGNSTSWLSPSGLFAFGFYQQQNGFSIGIWLITGEPEKTLVWTANRDSPPVSADSRLELSIHGLMFYRSEREKESITNLSNHAASAASMLDSGNFVVYGKNDDVLWQSFDFPTDTILGGQNLTNGNSLLSSMSKSDHSSGHFILSMQPDGNLVAYPANSSKLPEDAYWVTSTSGNGASLQLTLDREGVLCLWDTSRDFCFLVLGLPNSTFDLGKNTTLVYRAMVDEEGIFGLYQHRLIQKNIIRSSMKTVWRNFLNPCDVKGICSNNSYCLTKSTTGRADCKCYPGFVSLNSSSNLMVECVRNYTKDDCESSSDPSILYNVAPLRDMQWIGLPYFTQQMKMEACGKSCKEDCNCGAALYTEGSCNKYLLPLRYGKRIQNESLAIALFKLPSGITITKNHSNPVQLKPKVLIDNKKNLIFILVLTLGSISVFCLVFAMSVFFIYRRQIHSYAKLSVSENLEFYEGCSLRTFSFDELVESTGGFTEEIGKGSFGAVYRGIIRGTNRSIAVKKLDRVADEGEREFRAEITAIARTHHRNLVQLIGFCIDGPNKLLVYEYMSNGSLANILFKAEMRLSWKQRVKIALDVGRGVLYLHEECEVCIVHCNIKPQNILMDEAWTAKISDFGLARLFMPQHSTSTNRNERNSEYFAPEWQKDVSVSVKADIYSYGVVLLEIICCRRSIKVNVPSEEEITLSSWVYNCFVRGELNKLVADEEGVECKTLERMVKVGLWCAQDDPSLRPSMKNVILMLEGLKNIPIPPSPTTH